MTVDLRCANKKHAVLLDNGLIEVKCRQQFCGAGPGVVVLHRFSPDGTLVETLKFKNPERSKSNGADDNLVAVRSA